MIFNYFKIALRQFKKQKFHSSVNIIGLAIGVACCLIIALFIRDEWSYDQQHPDVSNLYRVALDINMNDFKGRGTAVPPILANTLVEEIPEIVQSARVFPFSDNAGSNLVRKKEVKQNQFESGFVYVDQSFFELFHLPLIFGEKETLLEKPNQVVISKKISDKYFAGQNPVGSTFVLNDDPDQSYVVSGVMENMPVQNHFHYDFLLSMPSQKRANRTNWIVNNFYTYVRLSPGTNPANLKDKFRSFTLKNFGPQFKEQLKTDLSEIEKSGQYYTVCLQPVTDIHLKSENYAPQLEANGDIRYIWMFGVVALFILIIAAVNFVNLSTARSANRAKEVGLRKVLGSLRGQLISQFLVESIVMSILAVLLGIAITAVLLPLFNSFSGKVLSIPYFSGGFLGLMLGASVVLGLLAGLYPSFYLSAFQPVKVLKGKLSQGSKNSWLRSSLVVIQFGISICLIIGTLVIHQQMEFIQNKKLGFEKDQVLLIQDTDNLGEQITAFKTALKQLPETHNASISAFLPLDGGRRNSIPFYPKGKDEVQDQVYLQSWDIDEDYINTLGMELLKGRDFDPNRNSDGQAVILNEAAAANFGILDNPIDQIIRTPFADYDLTVIGLVEDFHFESLKGKVEPVGFFLGASNRVVSVKSSAMEMESLIAKAEQAWNAFAPTMPFRYEFMDERFAKMYQIEDRVGVLFTAFSIVAILIACLGLLALVTFMTEQRAKEIGIRKVLGASVFGVVSLLSKDYLKLIIIALIIASPIAYYFMNQWLHGFEYTIQIKWWVYPLSGMITLVIAFMSVGFHSTKAALANPIQSLKEE